MSAYKVGDFVELTSIVQLNHITAVLDDYKLYTIAPIGGRYKILAYHKEVSLPMSELSDTFYLFEHDKVVFTLQYEKEYETGFLHSYRISGTRFIPIASKTLKKLKQPCSLYRNKDNRICVKLTYNDTVHDYQVYGVLQNDLTYKHHYHPIL